MGLRGVKGREGEGQQTWGKLPRGFWLAPASSVEASGAWTRKGKNPMRSAASRIWIAARRNWSELRGTFVFLCLASGYSGMSIHAQQRKEQHRRRKSRSKRHPTCLHLHCTKLVCTFTHHLCSTAHCTLQATAHSPPTWNESASSREHANCIPNLPPSPQHIPFANAARQAREKGTFCGIMYEYYAQAEAAPSHSHTVMRSELLAQCPL